MRGEERAPLEENQRVEKTLGLRGKGEEGQAPKAVPCPHC